MLRFLQRMPTPQACHRGMRAGHMPWVFEQAVGHDRGDMFQRCGGGQLPLG